MRFTTFGFLRNISRPREFNQVLLQLWNLRWMAGGHFAVPSADLGPKMNRYSGATTIRARDQKRKGSNIKHYLQEPSRVCRLLDTTLSKQLLKTKTLT